MLAKEHYDRFLPRELSTEIENICNSFREIQMEAAGIIDHNRMPDAAAQLNDVLLSTEEATIFIIDCATVILNASHSGSSDEAKNCISEQVTKIYEACNFQDIAGQRIKKVLGNLATLEAGLAKLSEIAKGYDSSSEKSDSSRYIIGEDMLMEGPQLSLKAPTQSEIDSLFTSGQ